MENQDLMLELGLDLELYKKGLDKASQIFSKFQKANEEFSIGLSDEEINKYVKDINDGLDRAAATKEKFIKEQKESDARYLKAGILARDAYNKELSEKQIWWDNYKANLRAQDFISELKATEKAEEERQKSILQIKKEWATRQKDAVEKLTAKNSGLEDMKKYYADLEKAAYDNSIKVNKKLLQEEINGNKERINALRADILERNAIKMNAEEQYWRTVMSLADQKERERLAAKDKALKEKIRLEEQYWKTVMALADQKEQERLSKENEFNRRMEAQKKASEERQAQLKKFVDKYEKTPEKARYDDNLTELNRLKKENIITSDQYAHALKVENEKLNGATSAQIAYSAAATDLHRVSALTNKELKEGFRIIDGKQEKLKGLALQWHDLTNAMNPSEGATTFGHKIGTTAQYMAAGLGIGLVTTAVTEAVRAFIEFDHSTRVMSAIMDTSIAKSRELGKELLNIGSSYGGTIESINQVALSLSRAGVEYDNLAKGTEIVIRMARLTGDTFEQSAAALISYQQVFGKTYTIEQLGDKLSLVANASRLTTQDIGTLSNYALAAAESIGMTIDTIGGLSAAFSNAGTNASTIGTSIRRFSTLLKDNGTEVETFFNKVGVNQSTLLRHINSNTADSNKAMIEFSKILASKSTEDFNEITKGMDVLAVQSLNLIRNNASSIEQIITISSDGSTGQLKNTEVIMESYRVSIESIWNSIKQKVITTSTEIGIAINKILTLGRTPMEQYAAVMKDMKETIEFKKRPLNAEEADKYAQKLTMISDLLKDQNGFYREKNKLEFEITKLYNISHPEKKILSTSEKLKEQNDLLRQATIEQARYAKGSFGFENMIIKIVKVNGEITKLKNLLENKSSKKDATSFVELAPLSDKGLSQLVTYSNQLKKNKQLSVEDERFVKQQVENAKTVARDQIVSTIKNSKTITEGVKANLLSIVGSGKDTLKVLMAIASFGQNKFGSIKGKKTDSQSGDIEGINSIYKMTEDLVKFDSLFAKTEKTAGKTVDYSERLRDLQYKINLAKEQQNGKEFTAVELQTKALDQAHKAYAYESKIAKDKDRQVRLKEKELVVEEAKLSLLKAQRQYERDIAEAQHKYRLAVDKQNNKNQSPVDIAKENLDEAKRRLANRTNEIDPKGILSVSKLKEDKEYLDLLTEVTNATTTLKNETKEYALNSSILNNTNIANANMIKDNQYSAIQYAKAYNYNAELANDTTYQTALLNENNAKLKLKDVLLSEDKNAILVAENDLQAKHLDLQNAFFAVTNKHYELEKQSLANREKSAQLIVNDVEREEKLYKIAKDKIDLEIKEKQKQKVSPANSQAISGLVIDKQVLDANKRYKDNLREQEHRLTMLGLVEDRESTLEIRKETYKKEYELAIKSGYDISQAEAIALEKSKSNWETYTSDLEYTYKNMMDGLENVTKNAFSGMEDAFVAYMKTGKWNSKDFVNSIISDLMKMTVQMTITANLAKALGMGSKMVGDWWNSSGGNTPTIDTNSDTYLRSLNTSYTGGISNGSTMERFASGYIAGGGYSSVDSKSNDVIPAMISKGEAVIPASVVDKNRGLIEALIGSRTQKFANGYVDSNGSAKPMGDVKVEVINQSGTQVQANDVKISQSEQNGMIISIIVDDIRRGGAVAQAIRS